MKKICLLLSLLIPLELFGQYGSDLEVFNIENRAVRAYMPAAESYYSENHNYSNSIVSKYNNSQYGTKLHWPQGYDLKWSATSPSSEISSFKITLTDESSQSKASTYILDDPSLRSYTLYNMIPERIYTYKVEEFRTNGSVEIIKEGRFRTEGQVRMIRIPNCSNIRDIGGWSSQYGGRIRYGLLYRSGSLNRVTSEGRHEFVDNMGVRAELDLRHEVNQSRSSLGSDIAYDRRRHEAGTKGLSQNKKDYAKDLRWIMDKLDKGICVDWHCAIGCDRCGALSFLIEGLLGMDELDLSRDFELSTFSLKHPNKRPRAHIKSMLDFIKKYGTLEDKSKEDYLARCFFNYWKSIGLRDDELHKFIGIMLEDYDGGHKRQEVEMIDLPHEYEIKFNPVNSTPLEMPVLRSPISISDPIPMPSSVK